MGFKNTHGFSGLDQEGFIVFQGFKTCQETFETGLIASSAACPPVYHEVGRIFGHGWVEIVKQHAQGCLLDPAFT
jgi:hypothetical protein